MIIMYLPLAQLTVSVKKIYDEYLGPNSPNEVNIDDRVKKSIEARLASPPLNIFHEAFEQVMFLSSQRFWCFFFSVFVFVWMKVKGGHINPSRMHV